MLYICVSFDYELFMGENRCSEKEVLIDPTNKLMKSLSQIGVSCTFFADVCCPMRYREFGETDFADLFDKQLRDLVRDGQDVQLHIHPHWFKTTEIGRNVEFDKTFYRIHNWADGEDYHKVNEIIRNGKEYLLRLLTPIFPDYTCIAFRAGGYCLQPEKKLIPILIKNGILIDSSVCRGFAHNGDGMFYNYTNEPKETNLYMNVEFGLSDSCVDSLPDSVFEVPIGGYATFPNRIIASKLNKPISKQPAKGSFMQLEKQPVPTDLFSKLRRHLTATNMLTYDSYNADSMTYMLNHIVREEKCARNDIFISTISHPKGMSDAHIENMVQSLCDLKKNPHIRFVNMREIAKVKNL